MAIKVLIRVDANKDIAVGHVKRCESLRDVLMAKKAQGAEIDVSFLTSPETLGMVSSFAALNPGVIPEGTNEESHLRGLFGKAAYDVVMVDGYHFTRDQHLFLRAQSGVPLVTMDEKIRSMGADTIVSFLPRERSDYRDVTLNEGAEIISPAQTGQDYWTVPESFRNAAKTVNAWPDDARPIKTILMSGGFDRVNLVGRVLDFLLRHPDHARRLDLFVPLPESGMHFKSVAMQVAQLKDKGVSIELEPGWGKIRKPMEACHLMISSASASLAEAGALGGRASIVFDTNQSQGEIAAAAANLGAAFNLGKHENLPDSAFDQQLSGALYMLYANKWLANHMARNLRQFADGNGTVRVADILLDRARPKVVTAHGL